MIFLFRSSPKLIFPVSEISLRSERCFHGSPNKPCFEAFAFSWRVKENRFDFFSNPRARLDIHFVCYLARLQILGRGQRNWRGNEILRDRTDGNCECTRTTACARQRYFLHPPWTTDMMKRRERSTKNRFICSWSIPFTNMLKTHLLREIDDALEPCEFRYFMNLNIVILNCYKLSAGNQLI